MNKTKVVCSACSACLMLLFLSVGPVLGQQDIQELNELNERVMKLFQAGKYAEALPLAQRTVDLSEKALGPTHPNVATTLNNLAEVYRTTGAYAKAEPLFQRALAIREKALGPEHLAVANTLEHLAVLYFNTGQYAKAEPLYQRALAIQEKALGLEHPAVATTLNNLAVLYDNTGQYAKVKPLYERALAIQEKALGPEHPDVANSFNNLAVRYFNTGQYAKAEPLYQRALAIEEKALGPEHPAVAITLVHLAELYRATGAHAKAEPLFQRALGILERVLGPEHPYVATTLNDLAELYRITGAQAKAEPLYQRALAIEEKALGPEHPDVATTLDNLAKLYDAAKAEPLYQRALAIREKTLGSEHPDVATTLNNLAVLYFYTGQYAKAEPFYQRALGIREKALGPEHPDVAGSLNNLGALEAAQGRFGLAAEFLKRGLLVQDRHIQNVFNITTEAEKLTFIESLSGGYQAALSLLHQHLNTNTEVIRDGMELVLRRKGIVFDAQSRAQEALKGRLSKTARKDFDQLSALRSELAHFLLNKPEKMSAGIYKERLNSLQQDIEATERRLASESALVAKELQQRTLTIEQVSKQLPRNAALAEFVKIRDFDFSKGRWKPSSRYLVFVLTAAGNVTLVDLGEAEALEHQADRTLEDIKVAMNTLRNDHFLKSQESLAQLSALVWKPLESSLGQADRLIVSPDGQLNLVPFAALVEGTGQPLVERYHLTYVSSGRELITTGAVFTSESELLLVANPAFDTQTPVAEPDITAVRSRDFRKHFAPLPGTAREAEEIPPLVTGRVDQKQVLVAAAATEGAVKVTRSPRILHLATHGFFLEDQPIELELVGRHAGFSTSVGTGVPSSSVGRYGNPLLRSGLAFAGANRAGDIPDGDDGLLTALEITGMDLHGTDLVVLSACETAVGMVHTGEGVFGLRRAFALAGAKNLLMSLWPVDDQVTADQMKAFYQNLQTLPPADALRQAQRETIRRLKERDGVANTGLWAPFILQGANGFGPVRSIADSK